MLEAIANYFGVDKKGRPNFELLGVESLQCFVGRVKSGARKVVYIPVFYIGNDFDREAYQEVCREVRGLNFDGKYYVFCKGAEIIQSPNVIFCRVSQDGMRVLDYSVSV